MPSDALTLTQFAQRLRAMVSDAVNSDQELWQVKRPLWNLANEMEEAGEAAPPQPDEVDR